MLPFNRVGVMQHNPLANKTQLSVTSFAAVNAAVAPRTVIIVQGPYGAHAAPYFVGVALLSNGTQLVVRVNATSPSLAASIVQPIPAALSFAGLSYAPRADAFCALNSQRATFDCVGASQQRHLFAAPQSFKWPSPHNNTLNSWNFVKTKNEF